MSSNEPQLPHRSAPSASHTAHTPTNARLPHLRLLACVWWDLRQCATAARLVAQQHAWLLHRRRRQAARPAAVQDRGVARCQRGSLRARERPPSLRRLAQTRTVFCGATGAANLGVACAACMHVSVRAPSLWQPTQACTAGSGRPQARSTAGSSSRQNAAVACAVCMHAAACRRAHARLASHGAPLFPFSPPHSRQTVLSLQPCSLAQQP
eukprot:358791-Chlamydomonas_euryale.AAC.3